MRNTGTSIPVPKYRTGRRNGHTIYFQVDDEPSDADIFIGSAVNLVWAAQLVKLANLGEGKSEK